MVPPIVRAWRDSMMACVAGPSRYAWLALFITGNGAVDRAQAEVPHFVPGQQHPNAIRLDGEPLPVSADPGVLRADWQTPTGPVSPIRIPIGPNVRRVFVDPNVMTVSSEVADGPVHSEVMERPGEMLPPIADVALPALDNAPMRPAPQPKARPAVPPTRTLEITEAPKADLMPSEVPPSLTVAQQPEPFAWKPGSSSAEWSESKLDWPTIIYKQSDIALLIPPTTDVVISAVELRRTSPADGVNPSPATTISAPVVDGRASFQGLAGGIYDVAYLDNAATSSDVRVPARRIIVELESADLRTLNQVAMPTRPLHHVSLRPTTRPVHEEFDEHVKRGWSLLDRQATYASIVAFRSGIAPHQVVARKKVITRAGDSVIDLLLKESVILTGDDARDVELIERLARDGVQEVGGRPELASAFHGLGKAYERIASEATSSVRHADQLSEICFRIASQLDPSLVGPLRDLALLYLRSARFEEGGQYLKEAARLAPDAEAQYALGRWYLEENQQREAAAAFAESCKLDPLYLPAAVELARLELMPQVRALDCTELRDLALRLTDFPECELLSARERRWAEEQLNRIGWLVEEADANAISMTARRWIPRDVRWVPSESATDAPDVHSAASPLKNVHGNGSMTTHVGHDAANWKNMATVDSTTIPRVEPSRWKVPATVDVIPVAATSRVVPSQEESISPSQTTSPESAGVPIPRAVPKQWEQPIGTSVEEPIDGVKIPVAPMGRRRDSLMEERNE